MPKYLALEKKTDSAKKFSKGKFHDLHVTRAIDHPVSAVRQSDDCGIQTSMFETSPATLRPLLSSS